MIRRAWTTLAVMTLAPLAARAAPPIAVRGQAGSLGYPAGVDGVNAGVAYGVSVALESPVGAGFELGYAGASNGTSRAAGDGPITENGAQVLLRSGPTYGAVRPYLATGYEVSWMNASERAQEVGVAGDEALQKVPVGAGVDFKLGGEGGGMLVGARGLYRFVFDSDFLGRGDGVFGDDQLSGTIVLGGGF